MYSKSEVVLKLDLVAWGEARLQKRKDFILKAVNKIEKCLVSGGGHSMWDERTSPRLGVIFDTISAKAR